MEASSHSDFPSIDSSNTSRGSKTKKILDRLPVVKKGNCHNQNLLVIQFT